MLANLMGIDSLWVVIIAIVVLFGGSQLPKLARNAGDAMKEFRKAHNDLDESTPAAPAQVVQQPTALPPPLASQAPAPEVTSTSEERVTLTRSELDALLADRERRAKAASSQEGQG